MKDPHLWERRGKIVLAVLVVIVLGAIAWQLSRPGALTKIDPQDAIAPICFTNELVAFAKGQTVLAALSSGSARDKAQIQALIGSRVLFDGSAGSGNADLKTGDDVFLEVEVDPPQEVRPHARNWVAEVVGVLTGVDFEKRAVHIKARPEEWKAYAAD